MNSSLNIDCFRARLADFDPQRYVPSRCLALYSAAVAVADADLMKTALDHGLKHGLTREQFYEIVLQSYLFLGFPRMLIAAQLLDQALPRADEPGTDTDLLDPTTILDAEVRTWRENGLRLCQRVYGDAFEPLRDKVRPMAPEVFDWMITEGYGKVLSRPNLSLNDRELSIVGFLMMENRPQQLHSHMRGAVNVGVPVEQLTDVVEDIGQAAGNGYSAAQEILERLETT